MEQVLLLTGLYKRGSNNLVSIINLQGIILVKLRSCGEPFEEFDLFYSRTGSPATNKNAAAKPQKTRLKIDKFIKKIPLALKNN